MGKLGTTKKGHTKLKLFPSPRRRSVSSTLQNPGHISAPGQNENGFLSVNAPCVLTNPAVMFVILLASLDLGAQSDSLPRIDGIVRGISLIRDSSAVHNDSLSRSNDPAQRDTLSKSGIVQTDSLSKKNKSIENSGLTNIILGGKKGIRANGWGEYRIKGKCLCCDNMVDGDCIIVWNTERTINERISQIVDGNIEGDIQDSKTYFGALKRREYDTHVAFLMAEISIKEMQDIKRVIVYTIVDTAKKLNYLSNCEFGYYDQFDRLQWIQKIESKKYNEPLVFEMEKPILTKKILLKIEGGKNIVTEVAIYRQN
jgi:hypothetical protein